MNQQTSYSLKASIHEYNKNNQTSHSEESVIPMKSIQNTPNVVELTRIMLGVTSKENTKKMDLDHLRAFCNITGSLLALTYQLS